jgi:hypothetical protein
MSTNGHPNKETWGAPDFERYYKGSMPASERHALEKAALDDSFLQDALDGYAFAANPLASLENLRQQLQETNKPEAKLVWFRQKNFQRLIRVAAILLITVSLTFVLFNNNNNEETPTLANNTSQNKIPESDTTATAKAAANLTITATDGEGNQVETKLPLFNQPSTQQPLVIASNDDTKSSGSNINGNMEDSLLNDLMLVNRKAEAKEKGMPQLSTKDRAAAPTTIRIPASIIRGQVINQEGIPVANARINDLINNQVIATDNNGNFELNNSRNTNNVAVDVNAAGYVATNSNLNNNTSNRIVLQTESQAKDDSEIVAAALPKKKFMANTEDSIIKEDLPGYFNMNRVTFMSVSPLAGWDAYNDFIETNLKTNANIGSKAKGNVVLSFSLNEMGKAINIVVKKSLDTSCDAEAIRFIQNSPPFKRNKRLGKIEAVIKF